MTTSTHTEPDWERFAAFPDLRSVIDQRDSKGFKNLLIDQIHRRAFEPFLDGATDLLALGSGVGRFANMIASKGIHYTGIDSCREMINQAKRAHPASSAMFRWYDGREIPFGPESFDVCASCWVLQYVINSPVCVSLLSEIHRVLKPGGRLILIEQARSSGQTSDTVSRSATESDYTKALGTRFHVRVSRCIRSGHMSWLSSRVILGPDFADCLKPLLLPALAKYEIWRSRHLRKEALTGVPYYDLLVEAVVK